MAGLAQLVERQFVDLNATGSSPVARPKKAIEPKNSVAFLILKLLIQEFNAGSH